MGAEDHRHIKVDDAKISVSGKNELTGSNSKEKKYQISLKPADVAILHPSFLCPVLKKVGDEDGFSIIVLTDAMFHNTYEKAEGKEDKKAGPALSGAVDRYLNIVKWTEIDKTSPANEPIFSTLDEAKENIEVHFLWKLSELEDYTLKNKDDKVFAQIDHRVSDMYQSKGLVYGFEIIIKNLPNDVEGLYNISWMDYKKPKAEDEEGYFFELQDNYVKEFNKEYLVGYPKLKCCVKGNDAPNFTEEPTEIQSYHPLYISNKESLDIGHLSDVHISSRQHIFTKSKARLIDGKEGDDNRSDEIGSMVNTSYATLKNLMNQMGGAIDLLIFTGDLIDYNRNFNPNNSVNGTDTLNKSSNIWKALNLDNLKDKTQYPIGIDNLVMYELFKKYYDDHGKPIMLVSGNHEAYTLPYGISPRVKISRAISNSLFSGKWVSVLDDDGEPIYDEEGFEITKFEKLTEDEVIEKSTKEAKADLQESKDGDDPNIYFDRANDGIAADHNLTISEAILMYGPDFARIVMAAASDTAGERNFKPENLSWFYHVFTPLSSYITSYGEQCFIGLGWGEDEKFIGKKQGEWSIGSFLPRATESISDAQLALLTSALDEEKSCNVLCSHFTYANYNTPQAFSEEGEINSNDLFGTLGKHDFGTFESNRNEVYKNITDNKIKYTLSGHSHRSGLYQVKDSDTSWVPRRDTMSITAQATKDNKFNPVDGCRMLVAACGGPIAVQNHNNELFNWGLDYPSGNYIKFSGEEESEIGIKTPSIKQAQPRMSVALDYADIFLRDKNHGGLIKEFSSDDNGDFILRINPEAKMSGVNIFRTVSLILYDENIPFEIVGQIKLKKISKENGDLYSFIPDKSIRSLLKKSKKDNPVLYIKIHLIESDNTSFNQYSFENSWTYPVHILEIPLIKDEEDDYDSEEIDGYVIERHSMFGEIPNFIWYKKWFADEYK
ncbi:MAG: metallophosphoesterase [Woeseiaceae bacterium]